MSRTLSVERDHGLDSLKFKLDGDLILIILTTCCHGYGIVNRLKHFLIVHKVLLLMSAAKVILIKLNHHVTGSREKIGTVDRLRNVG